MRNFDGCFVQLDSDHDEDQESKDESNNAVDASTVKFACAPIGPQAPRGTRRYPAPPFFICAFPRGQWGGRRFNRSIAHMSGRHRRTTAFGCIVVVDSIEQHG